MSHQKEQESGRIREDPDQSKSFLKAIRVEMEEKQITVPTARPVASDSAPCL